MPVVCEYTFEGITKSVGTKASLPQAIAAPSIAPIKLHRVGSFFGTSDLGCKSLAVDFGIQATRVFSSTQQYGFGGWQTVGMAPTVTINPLFDSAFETLKRAATTGGVFLQFGQGAYAASVLNTVGLHLAQAQIRKSDGADVDGLRRSALELFASDKVRFDATTQAVFGQLCRA